MEFNWKPQEPPKATQEFQNETTTTTKTGGRQELPVNTKSGGGDLIKGAGLLAIFLVGMAIANGYNKDSQDRVREQRYQQQIERLDRGNSRKTNYDDY